jgi:hypothetical protein
MARYRDVLADLSDIRADRLLAKEARVISAKHLFKNGGVLLPATSSELGPVPTNALGREPREQERKSADFSLDWRRGTNLLDAVSFFCKMFRILPFNTKLLEVHLDFLHAMEEHVEKEKNNLEKELPVQWKPPPPNYGSDDEEHDDDVQVSSEMTCSLGATACSITSAEHRLLPLNPPPTWGKGGVVRHFKASNRAMKAVRLAYSRDVSVGRVGRTATIQFPNEREVVSETELVRKSRDGPKLIPMYDVAVECLDKDYDRFGYSGWVNNLADAAGIHCAGILPLKNGEYKKYIS